jgi:hypothetical protein
MYALECTKRLKLSVPVGDGQLWAPLWWLPINRANCDADGHSVVREQRAHSQRGGAKLQQHELPGSLAERLFGVLAKLRRRLVLYMATSVS